MRMRELNEDLSLLPRGTSEVGTKVDKVEKETQSQEKKS